MLEHNPDYLTINQIPFPYYPEDCEQVLQGGENIKKYLASSLPNKEEQQTFWEYFWILHDTGYAVSEIPYTERKWWNRKVCGSIADPACSWNHQYVQYSLQDLINDSMRLECMESC